MKKRDFVIKRNIMLKEILLEHKGRENAIKTREICMMMKDFGFEIKPRYLPKLIKSFREEWLMPVCFIKGKGYYMPSCTSDIRTCVTELQVQIDALQETVDFLNKWIVV